VGIVGELVDLVLRALDNDHEAARRLELVLSEESNLKLQSERAARIRARLVDKEEHPDGD
jgi:hypothetical protein